MGVLITPPHPPGPDLDPTELRERSDRLREHYRELAERVAAVRESDGSMGGDYPEGRMYM
jgi:uncharacterized protein